MEELSMVDLQYVHVMTLFAIAIPSIILVSWVPRLNMRFFKRIELDCFTRLRQNVYTFTAFVCTMLFCYTWICVSAINALN